MRVIAPVVLVAGVLLMLVALTADGLGLGGHPGLGWKQIAGAVAGCALAAFGMLRMRRSGATVR